ncbi:Dynamin-like GTPase that mediates homotypic ER fusion [Malassezia yamatoensis]|uniref:Dynamin-like GTPase that mediates homotypic ER fusion n=1 Tax=Malassezia yamatoensis TaxID=253288 RepID=A0AAJ5YT54_9BASI|nr:Dynamin-like GTPase that mediates homotypic ER fusion [Malassezia yamatoensis]
MDRDVEMARAALAGVSNMPRDDIRLGSQELRNDAVETSPVNGLNRAVNPEEMPGLNSEQTLTGQAFSDEQPLIHSNQQSQEEDLLGLSEDGQDPTSKGEPTADMQFDASSQSAVQRLQAQEQSQDASESIATSQMSNRLQLIDEQQEFHTKQFQEQLAQWGMTDVGFGYDLCAVLGSQSTGKSTLLNKLFGTNFEVMNERARQQTTKGIWLSRGMERNMLVMDVEGTDGRERGEDQDFERKSSLFALTTAECLIVNMWENQVGLYQGANMGLLKTVLDVNLSLFQSGRARAGAAHDKTLLLFVIRDYLGTTPLENLESVVQKDLDRIWASLSKPSNLAEAKLSDYFDVMFTALPHKVLQPGEFDASVDLLRSWFINRSDPNYVFQTQYHKQIPIDGLPRYLEGIWEQVVQNKDLDLPTQQELLAQFRCDEIAEVAVRPFQAAIQALRKVLDSGTVLSTLGQDIAMHRTDVLAAFDKDASRYHRGVYTRKRNDLVDKLNTALLPAVLAQLKNLHVYLAEQFRHAILEVIRHSTTYNFGDLVRKQHDLAIESFDEMTSALLLPETDWTVDEERRLLEAELTRIAHALRLDETKKLALQLQREIGKKISEPLELALSHPSPTMWDEVLTSLQKVMTSTNAIYLERSASLNSTADEDVAGSHALQRGAWRQFLAKVHQQTAEAVLSVRLRAYFEERFRYDQEGVPRVLRPTDDMDGIFVSARDATLRLIPMYAQIAPTDSALLSSVKQSIQDPVYLESVQTGDEEPLDVDESLRILSELQMTELGNRFRRDADTFYVEAKRSTVSSMSSVPWWMYGVLVVLGWNEFMAVIRSPVYFTLMCMLLAGAYAVWRLNMGGPLMRVATTLARETQQTIEDQLRAYLVPPAAAQAPQSQTEQHELHERRTTAPVAL